MLVEMCVCVCVYACMTVCLPVPYLEYISALGFTTWAGSLKSGPLLVIVHPASITGVSESHTFTLTLKPLKDNLFLAQTCSGFPYRCLLPNMARVFQRYAHVFISRCLSAFCLAALGSNAQVQCVDVQFAL